MSAEQGQKRVPAWLPNTDGRICKIQECASVGNRQETHVIGMWQSQWQGPGVLALEDIPGMDQMCFTAH